VFIDEVKIYVKAGDGGDGVVHFRREKYVPRGGPDGGDGGKGGDVVLLASTEISTLLDLRYQQHYIVKSGDPGAGSRSFGHSSPNRVIPVPVGTVVRDWETDEPIGDLTVPGQRLVVAKGGAGGRGNYHFKSPIRQAPQTAEPGMPGEARWLHLELKLLADVGLVGLPNAGKSTLISTISAARPKVADYPFTTLVPHLGVVSWGGRYGLNFTVADLPGLIEGAHNGRGLGIRFLRHVERCALLLHLVDVASDGDPVQAFEVVRCELAAYASALANKPFLVAATKIDAAGKGLTRLKNYCHRKKIPFHAISSAAGTGIQPLVNDLGRRILGARAPTASDSPATTRIAC